MRSMNTADATTAPTRTLPGYNGGPTFTAGDQVWRHSGYVPRTVVRTVIEVVGPYEVLVRDENTGREALCRTGEISPM